MTEFLKFNSTNLINLKEIIETQLINLNKLSQENQEEIININFEENIEYYTNKYFLGIFKYGKRTREEATTLAIEKPYYEPYSSDFYTYRILTYKNMLTVINICIINDSDFKLDINKDYVMDLLKIYEKEMT